MNYDEHEVNNTFKFGVVYQQFGQVSIYPSVCPSVYLSVCLSVCPSICLSACLPVYMSVYMSIYLSISFNPSFCLHIRLSDSLLIIQTVSLSFYRDIILTRPISNVHRPS